MATKRNGLQKFLNICHFLCGYFGTWKPKMITAINASELSTSDKNKLIAAIEAIEVACDAVDLIRVVWE